MHGQIDEAHRAFIIGFIEPLKRLILLSQSHVNQRDAVWRHILPRGLLQQFMQNRQRLRLFPATA